MSFILGEKTELQDLTFQALVYWTQELKRRAQSVLLTSTLVFLFTSEETRVINWSWVDILISHLVFIPAVKSHIFLPLFEPVSVHQIPAERAKYVMSVPLRRAKLKFKCGAISLKRWHRADSYNSSRGVSANLSLRCFSSGQLATWFWQVFSIWVRLPQMMEPQTDKPHKASSGLASEPAQSQLLTTQRNQDVALQLMCHICLHVRRRHY